jgi:hypothetical protein
LIKILILINLYIMLDIRKLVIALVLIYVIADKHTCPRYTCDSGTGTSCVNLKTGLATDGYNKISLTDICKNDEEHCDIPPPPFQTLADADKDTVYTCKANTVNPSTPRRYPGEVCDANEDCIKSGDKTGTCDKGKCTGVAKGESCPHTADCVVGTYCDAETKKCVDQKKKGKACKKSTECINTLLCHKQTCNLTPYSLNAGTVLDEDDPKFNTYKCKFGLMDNSKCISMIQEEDGNEDGFIECSYGDKCKYKLDDMVQEQDCQCGYNTDGKGYCQRGFNKSKYCLNFRGETNNCLLFENWFDF